MQMRLRFLGGTVVADALAVRLGGVAGANAKTVTKMTFRLNDRRVAPGDDVTGWVRLWTRTDKAWQPLAHVPVAVLVDGVEVSRLTTDGHGVAYISHPPASPGGHAMKVVYAGDQSYSGAKRARGFHVGTSDS